MGDAPESSDSTHRRRKRYGGKHPRRFEDKYKEHAAERYPDAVEKVLAAGKTPAGMHRAVMVEDVLAALDPQPGQLAVDCTLGYGGHARELLERIRPGGRLIGIDADPIELSKTERRLRALGFGSEEFVAVRSNFAGLAKALASHGSSRETKTNREHPVADTIGADVVLADLGVSSMQLDDPSRGFSLKMDGPLDMRLNPARGRPASALLQSIRPDALAKLLIENADEPRAQMLAAALAGRTFVTTRSLAEAIRTVLATLAAEQRDLAARRVFQALRIAVNDEFSALDALLRDLPKCLKPHGRVAILTFHSGEDRRVKKAFEAGCKQGVYSAISDEVIRPTAAERRANPRSTSAKLRWARRSGAAWGGALQEDERL